eukprot:NODE_43_length_33755_cov_1.178542.p2 type:complete len:616 gc:universal NODE_43_length_33755_cov_1.178542:30277-28430(-)
MKTYFKFVSKRLFFGIFLGILIAVYFTKSPSNDMDKVQFFLNNIMRGNFTQIFGVNQVETTPAIEFLRKYKKKHKAPYKKRFTLLIPGIGTSHLSLWKSTCLKNYLRNQIWGSPTMILALLSNKQCWMDHMKLVNGTDPEGIKVRPIRDLESAEYFMGNYWVWARIVENLIALDYDINDIHAAVYDWRLAHSQLEKRDGYFNELKSIIENKVRHTGLKAVVLTHSMGGLVFYYFLKWVESQHGAGSENDGWVSDHINSVVNIGAPFLGVPKLIAGVLSGEMKDTAQLGPYGNAILESVFNRAERRDLFWSWFGMFSMLPKGGNRVWGSEWISADDTMDRKYQKCFTTWLQSCPKKNFDFYFANYGFDSGAMVTLVNENINLPVDSLLEMLGEFSNKPKEWKQIKNLYSHDFILSKDMNFTDPDDIVKSWTNPLASALPKMYREPKTETGKFLHPSELNNTLKIYCFYGHGKPTERKYFYKDMAQLLSNVETSPQIDVTYVREKSNTRHGVQMSDGDGTVNLLSLSGVCLEAWRLKKYNPSKIPVIVKEYEHIESSSLDPQEMMRGGKKTADHIDILGNYELIEDVLRLSVYPPLKVSKNVRNSTVQMAKSLHLSE